MIPIPQTENVPLGRDADGVVRVGKTRVTLDTVVAAFNEGATAEEIAQQYPSLALADVYSVLGYYLRHRPELDAYLGERAQRAAQVRAENEARFDPSGVRDRLLARRVGGSRGRMLRLLIDEDFNVRSAVCADPVLLLAAASRGDYHGGVFGTRQVPGRKG